MAHMACVRGRLLRLTNYPWSCADAGGAEHCCCTVKVVKTSHLTSLRTPDGHFWTSCQHAWCSRTQHERKPLCRHHCSSSPCRHNLIEAATTASCLVAVPGCHVQCSPCEAVCMHPNVRLRLSNRRIHYECAAMARSWLLCYALWSDGKHSCECSGSSMLKL